MQKVHFIGISGIGMSAVAVMMKSLGWEVSGSDEASYPPASDYLIKAGINFVTGYRKENIPRDASLIVLGRNAKLSPETNEEVQCALESGIRIQSFPEILGEMTHEKETLVVAGSFGKSTCTAIAAWILTHAGKDPSYFVGAVAPSLGATARVGAGAQFVLEGDEYPTSHTDARSKFLHYRATHVLLTSAMHDHVNVFPTSEAYEAPFVELLSSLPKGGVIVASLTPETDRVLEKAGRTAITYSARSKSAFWHAENISYKHSATFDLYRDSEKVAFIESPLLGEHNVENVVGVAALLSETGLATLAEVTAAVKEFKGVRRRLDNVAPASRLPVFEGFGSSYEKSRAAIEAIKLHFPTERLVVVFEPHTFGLRNRANLSWYDTMFRDVDVVFVAPPEEQGALTHDQLRHEEIVNRVRGTGIEVKPFGLDDESAEDIVGLLEENDVVLILTSGNMEGLTESVPKKIEIKFPRT